MQYLIQNKTMRCHFDIYHKSVAAIKNEHGSFPMNCLPGQVFIGLGDSEAEEFFGWYPEQNEILCSAGMKIDDETDVHDEYQATTKKNQKYLFKKRIILSVDQYTRALNFAKSLFESLTQDNQVINFNESIDFIQSVYNAANLPLHFTHIYSSEELLKLPNLTSYQLSETFEKNYGSRINVLVGTLVVSGSSKVEIISRLNIPVERIKQMIKVDLNDSPAVSFLSIFEVKLEKSDFLPKDLIVTVNSQSEPKFETSLDAELEYISQYLEQQSVNDKNEIVLNEELSSNLLLRKQKSLESEKKLESFIFKVNMSLEEYHLKIEKTIKFSLSNLYNLQYNEMLHNDEKNLFVDELKSEILQIESSFKDKKNNLIAQKQNQLNAEIQACMAETTKYNLSTMSFAIAPPTISIADVAEKKQAELNLALERYKAEYDCQIEDVKNKYLLQKLKDSSKNIQFIAFKIFQEIKSFLKNLKLQIDQVNEKLSYGNEYVDVESVANYIDVQISAHLYKIYQIYNTDLSG